MMETGNAAVIPGGIGQIPAWDEDELRDRDDRFQAAMAKSL